MEDLDSDNDSLVASNTHVDLGFIEKVEPWKLESRFFPCKVGQRPTWLSFTDHIPSREEVICENCHEARKFLLQLYAPLDGKEYCFHRMLYVFVCCSQGCIEKDNSFKVFRSQLPRKNNFFPFEAPEENESWGKEITAHQFGIKLCQVCGLKSLKNCSVCKETFYCSKEHQIYDWKAGHKKNCNNRAVFSNGPTQVSILFPEYEITIESENCDDSDKLVDECDEKILEKVGEGSLSGVACDEELSKMALADEDKQFTKFQERIKSQSDQVIRYDRCGSPLWVSSQNIPVIDTVPNCQYCGGKRVFEFQIMPQLLCYLKADTIPGCEPLDWGTVAIFTCESSCGNEQSENAYREEFAMKQDFTV
ncbi:hypothetical protein LSTR_LSTR005856 [Laodelphax striatellus]|uniref:MYND-type domain-containing protein n=1 Tax=Laodelphax striatellus TaxID=195883 RepID=A0A482WSP4_LAOST|nr:hypothetical protein LSTR_LSTR005856 [Laodelphax striatellus]